MADESDAPKRYIRTFAGDQEALKQGTTPDLVPLIEPLPPAAAPAASVPPPVQPPVQTFAPAPPPAASKPTELETYSGDFSQRMKDEHAVPTSVLAAEQDAGPRVFAPEIPQKPPRSNLLYIIGGVVLLLVGISAVVFFYLRFTANNAPVVIAPAVSAPIFVDARAQVSGTGPALAQAIEQSVAAPLAANTVRLLYPQDATTTSLSVFSALGLPAPGILLRNISAAGSMAGIVNANGAQSPFFILAVQSYGDTFSGMLSWEPTMAGDLAALFPPYPAPIVATTTPVATTTTKTVGKAPAKAATTTPSAPVAVAGFRDGTIDNHDARLYLDAAGHSILVYGYWNQTTLVIARDPASFTLILNRLANSRTQ